MAQSPRSGCFAALLTLVALGSLAGVGVGLFIGGWYWWTSRAPPTTLVQGGPWTLTVDNPNGQPINVSCALESSPPVEIAAGQAGRLTITTLPATCTGTTGNGDKVLEFAAQEAPTERAGWRATATLFAPPEAPEEDGEAPAPERPIATAEAAQDKTVRATRPADAPKAPKSTTPPKAKPPEPAPPPPTVRAAPLMFKYPGGPKFADIQVSVDGRDVGTRPTGVTVNVGSHTVQFFKDGLVNISCPIDVDEDGRVVSLPRKLTCPTPRE